MRVFKSAGQLAIMRDLRIIDFRIVEGAPTVVEYIVQQNIKDGWQPFGSAAIAMMGNVPICVQAIVKYEPITDEPQPTNEGDKP